MAKVPTSNQADNIIDGSPTKEFFITMLIKDINLRDAIGDLIDNSVDAAKFNTKNPTSLKGFYIKVTANKTRFEIEDNCGGIEVDIAQEYAFKFGRDKKYKLNPHSIGQFGIGMKRAFFKIGNHIDLNSVAQKSSFNMHIAVSDWRKNENDWNFVLDRKMIQKSPLDKCGTRITVTNLSEDAKANFDLASFHTSLKDEIEREHIYHLSKGLQIYINDKELNSRELKFSSNSEFKPAHWHHKFESGLKVDVYAGVGEDKGSEGGWYIFCNDRLITGPDTSADTGWTGIGKDGVAIYHDQFYRFRGYVFFDSVDASKLPWNTTKTGMNLDSHEYKYVRQQMINMMKPVMTFMNLLKKEKEKNTPDSERQLNNKIANVPVVNLTKIIANKTKLEKIFTYPVVKVKISKTGNGKITYSKPYEQIDKVKSRLGLTRLPDIGEYTFDYFYKNEIED